MESHLILETKQVNDERTHCHFTLMNVVKKTGHVGLHRAYALGFCNHIPPCGTILNA